MAQLCSHLCTNMIHMKLKELLNKVEFDNVAPYIVQHYPDMAKCLSGFKEAFDGMRNTMPANLDDEQVKVEYYIEEGKEPWSCGISFR